MLIVTEYDDSKLFLNQISKVWLKENYIMVYNHNGNVMFDGYVKLDFDFNDLRDVIKGEKDIIITELKQGEQ